MLTSQLENQRFYYQEKIRELEERFNEQCRSMQQKVALLRIFSNVKKLNRFYLLDEFF